MRLPGSVQFAAALPLAKPVFRPAPAVITVVALFLLNRLPNGAYRKPERMAGVYVYNKELLEEKPTLLYAGNIRHSQKTCKYHKQPKRKHIKTHLKISSNTAHPSPLTL